MLRSSRFKEKLTARTRGAVVFEFSVLARLLKINIVIINIAFKDHRAFLCELRKK